MPRVPLVTPSWSGFCLYSQWFGPTRPILVIFWRFGYCQCTFKVLLVYCQCTIDVLAVYWQCTDSVLTVYCYRCTGCVYWQCTDSVQCIDSVVTVVWPLPLSPVNARSMVSLRNPNILGVSIKYQGLSTGAVACMGDGGPTSCYVDGVCTLP